MLTVNATQVQKLQLRGPVGYTKVGSPTITDGVASGFSANDYLMLNTQLDTTKPFELVYRCNPSLTNVVQDISGYPLGGVLHVLIRANGHFCFFLGTTTAAFDIASIEGNSVAQVNTWYFIKAVFTGTKYQLYLSSDNGATWNLEGEATSSVFVNNGEPINLYIGNGHNQNWYFNGSIDLNETYIKVNGKLWFYQPAPTKYVVKDDKLVFADSGLYLTGPVTYTKVGSPTIVDGIASGFSSSKYLYIASNTIDLSNLSVRLRFTADVLDGSEQILLQMGGAGNAIPLGFRIHTDNRLVCYHCGTNINQIWSFADTNLEQGKTYDVEFGSVNSVRYFKCGLADNMTDQTITAGSDSDFEGTITRPVYCGFASGADSSKVGKCSIDLKETYIKIDGSLWFYGKNYASKNIAPVPSGYTYGNTTTSAIGYVDMRTQQFTAAPSGATIGRDE